MCATVSAHGPPTQSLRTCLVTGQRILPQGRCGTARRVEICTLHRRSAHTANADNAARDKGIDRGQTFHRHVSDSPILQRPCWHQSQTSERPDFSSMRNTHATLTTPSEELAFLCRGFIESPTKIFRSNKRTELFCVDVQRKGLRCNPKLFLISHSCVVVSFVVRFTDSH